MLTVPFFYECEILNLHRDIFIVKTQFLIVDLTHKLISNNFFGVKMDFRFRKKKNGTVATYDNWPQVRVYGFPANKEMKINK